MFEQENFVIVYLMNNGNCHIQEEIIDLDNLESKCNNN